MSRRIVGLAATLLAACEGPVTEPAPVDRTDVVSDRLLVAIEPGASTVIDSIPSAIGVRRVTPRNGRMWIELELAAGTNPIIVGKDLGHIDGIISAQPRFRYTPDVVPRDPQYTQQYAHRITQAELAWNLERGRRDVVVAVIGTGVALNHPDLVPNLWINDGEIPNNGIDDDANGFVDDVHGWDFLDDDGHPAPTSAHETGVAGVIGARADNDIGISGVAWRTQLMVLRVDYESNDIADAIDYAVANGASVINMSFGSYVVPKYGTDTIVEDALLAAEQAGVVTVSTAGNDAIRTKRFPAALPTVLAVAATDERDQRAPFSNHGVWIDVAAPGAGILTTRLSGYGVVDGTSFAAPYVAGVAALVRARHPAWTAEQIRDVIRFTGDRIATNEYVGSTRINAYNAVRATEPPKTFARIAQPTPSETQPHGSTVQIIGSAIGDDYQLAIRPRGADRWTTFASGHLTRNGLLGVLDTTDLTTGFHQLRLTTTFGSQLAHDIIALNIDDGFVPGFPYVMGDQSAGAPRVVDLDGDGDLEVIIVDTRGLVHAVHHDGTPVAGWPVDLTMPSMATAAVGDIDGDGDVEVLVSGLASNDTLGRVAAWHHDGTVVSGWPVDTQRTAASVVLADIDRDDDLEVIVVDGGTGTGRVNILHGNGVSQHGWPVRTGFNLQSPPVVGDIDGDGEVEIVVSGFEDEYVFNLDGTAAPGWPRSILGSHMGLALGDVDRDGALDMLVMERHQVALVEAGRSVRPGWPKSLAIGPYSTGALADLDQDGQLEVVVVDTFGAVHVFDANGNNFAGWPKTQLGPLTRGVAIADIDGDGSGDIVVTSVDDLIFGWSAHGDAISGFVKRLPVASLSPPILTDLDGDDRIDLVVGTDRGIYALALGRFHDVTTLEWPEGRHDGRSSGYQPRRLSLVITSTAVGTVRLRVETPTDIPRPTRYVVYRDRRRIGSTWTDRYFDRVPPDDRNRSYVVTAEDAGRSILARSDEIEVDPITLFCRSHAANTPCDDKNPCTVNDVCGEGVCAGAPAEEGVACDDGNRCTRTDACTAGICVGRDPVQCKVGPCLISACQTDSGECVERVLDDGTSCHDGQVCTAPGHCSAGACLGTAPVQDGTACDDGDPCSDGELCLFGACVMGAPVVCDAPGACEEGGQCDALVGGCVYTQAAEGSTCDDNNRCTLDDVCKHGICVGTGPSTCETSDTRPVRDTDSSVTEHSGCGCESNGRQTNAGALVLLLGLCLRRRKFGR